MDAKVLILKKLFLSFLFCFAALCLYTFCRSQTDGFTIAKIRSSPSFSFSCPPKQAEEFSPKIFEQPFFYLGSGAQTFAFVSEDGKYVLKLFSHHKGRHPLQGIAFALPPPWKKRLEATVAKRERRLINNFNGYAIASEYFFDESGLLYLHLAKGNELQKTVTLYDKIGVVHKIDLDEVEFVLQKKADLIYPTLALWIAEESLEKSEQALTELVALLHTRGRRGIYDKDPDLETNFGFVDSVPIQFDTGRFKKSSALDPRTSTEELIRITDRLCQWLDEKCPPLADHVRKTVGEES
ncbi:MAG: hypothetical protein KR126chlam1_00378 [Chlamydiae bacterium]|nr:hypothetical protein [Chlamydiota bacterium]